MEKKPKLLSYALVVLFLCAVPGCNRDSSDTGSTQSQGPQALTIRIVNDPLIKPYLTARKSEFEQTKPMLSDGRQVKIELVTAPGLTASKEIAEGRQKVDAWLTPSRALVNHANSHTVNLGSKLVECRQLFGTPLVFAANKETVTALKIDLPPFSWSFPFKNLLKNNTVEGAHSKTVTFSHGAPGESEIGLLSLIEVAYLTTVEPDKAPDLAELKSKGSERLKKAENLVYSYGVNEQKRLSRAAAQDGEFLRLVLTTEQQIVLYNLDKRSEHSLSAVYPAEGSFWQDYALCRSDSDWVTPDRRAAIKMFAAFLAAPPAQTEALKLGFRPSDPGISAAYPLVPEMGIRPHLPATAPFPAPTGEHVDYLLANWAEIRRPAATVLVLDISGSMQGEPLGVAQQRFNSMLTNMYPRDLAALVTFSNAAVLQSDFTADHAHVAQQVRGLTVLGGSALYDGINLALQVNSQRDLKEYRKTIFVVTDGQDKDSQTNLPLLISALKNTMTRQDLDLVIVGIKNPGFQADALSDIAKAADGEFRETAVENMYTTLEEVWQDR